MGPVVIFFQRGEYEAMHQGLSIAASATALGRKCELYFSWYALERLVKGPLDGSDLRDDVADHFEKEQVPDAAALLEAVRGSGLAFVAACSGSLTALGLKPPDVEASVDQLLGWTTILQRTAGIADRFFV